LEEAELIAQELSALAEKLAALEKRTAAVEAVHARLEQAALTTAHALQEVAGHWDAVYEVMRRVEAEPNYDLEGLYEGEGSFDDDT
jgi:hypothetical protein